MDDVIIARALHVVSIVLWIGGVGFVTTVLLPAVRHLKEPKDRLEFLDRIERRFAREARLWVTIVGMFSTTATAAAQPSSPARSM